MEITNFNQLRTDKKNVNFPLQEENRRERGGYFASYYQLKAEQKKRERKARYKAGKFGISLKVVDGIIGGEPKQPLTKKERNQNYYLKAKQNKKVVNDFVASLARPHPSNQRKDYRKEKQATKTFLRLCGTISSDIYISNFRGLSERGGINKNKGGRPKKLHALTSTERSRKRRAILKANQPANKWQRLFLKMLDVPRVRLQTNIKVPWKAGRKLNGWQIWNEKTNWAELIKRYGEVGVRTGIIVYWYGRKYYFYWLDNDILKKWGIPAEARQAIFKRLEAWHKKRGIAFSRGNGGLNTPILSKEKLPAININYQHEGKNYKPSQLLGEGLQAQFIGVGKTWEWGKPLIVKNVWGLCQINNRKELGGRFEERDRKKINRKRASNIKVYQPAELQQKYNELLSQYKENETWQLQTFLTDTKRIKANWKGASVDPHIAYTNDFFFFFNAYQKCQMKLAELCGQSVRLELKRGRSQIFLNRIINQPRQPF